MKSVFKRNKDQFGPFCTNLQMILMKVTPTATIEMRKNSDKSHGSADMFHHRFGRSIFPVKIEFS